MHICIRRVAVSAVASQAILRRVQYARASFVVAASRFVLVCPPPPTPGHLRFPPGVPPSIAQASWTARSPRPKAKSACYVSCPAYLASGKAQGMRSRQTRCSSCWAHQRSTSPSSDCATSAEEGGTASRPSRTACTTGKTSTRGVPRRLSHNLQAPRSGTYSCEMIGRRSDQRSYVQRCTVCKWYEQVYVRQHDRNAIVECKKANKHMNGHTTSLWLVTAAATPSLRYPPSSATLALPMPASRARLLVPKVPLEHAFRP